MKHISTNAGDIYEPQSAIRPIDSSTASCLHLPQILLSVVKWVQYLFSGLLLFFAIAILMFSLTISEHDQQYLSSPVTIILFWVLVVYLGCLEGGQNALVGLQSLNPSQYLKSHPYTSKAVQLTSSHNNLQRFLMGRQFLTIILIFGITSVGNISDQCSSIPFLPSFIIFLFCQLGFALMIVTILLGQVTCQILSTKYMKDFINNRVFLITVYLSIGIEYSGILHVVHCASDAFQYFSGVAAHDSQGQNHTTPSRLLYWCQITLSFCSFGFSLACVIHEILVHHTTMWSGFPSFASIILFFFLLASVGMLEGLQIALFAASNLDLNLPVEDSINIDISSDDIPSPLTPSRRATESRDQHPSSASIDIPNVAQKNCLYVFSAKNFSSFVVGRQICVTILTFILAKITAMDTPSGYTTFGLPSFVQQLINTGILAAYITTILGSLIFRVIASQYPLEFLSLSLIYPVIRLCTLIESTGIMRFANAIARAIRVTLQLRSDESYSEEENHVPEVSVVVSEV